MLYNTFTVGAETARTFWFYSHDGMFWLKLFSSDSRLSFERQRNRHYDSEIVFCGWWVLVYTNFPVFGTRFWLRNRSSIAWFNRTWANQKSINYLLFSNTLEWNDETTSTFLDLSNRIIYVICLKSFDFSVLICFLRHIESLESSIWLKWS